MTGADIKRWREAQNLRIRELAQLLCVNDATVSRSEGRGPSRLFEVLLRQLQEKVASGAFSISEYLEAQGRKAKPKKLGRPRRRGRPRKYPKGSKRRGKPGRPRKPGRPKGKKKSPDNSTKK